MAKPQPVNLDDAYQAFDDGNYEDALRLSEAALKKAPKDRDAALLHAACVDAMGDPEGALAEYEDLTRRYPHDAEVWVRMGDVCVAALNDPEMAYEALTQALEAATTEGHEDEEMLLEAHLRLVDVCLDLRELDEALRHAKAAKQMDKDNSDVELALGRAEFERGNMDEALKAAARAVDKDPQNAGAYFLRGLVLERQGNPDAEKAFERSERLDPEFFSRGVTVTAEELRAVAQSALEELPSRVRDYMRKLQINVEDLPSDVDVRSSGGTLSPSALGAMRGTPLSEESDADPFTHMPRDFTLYRLNLMRVCRSRKELQDEVAMTMVDEVGHFLHLTEDDLVDSGDED
ncbi:MAG: tetratricopeptide repeat protein [Myxococcota bacterium]